ncbi:MAG TPA: dolichyl-phosphate beta-glucosyltransferase [Candidatus Polarisedimenticolia bacterium]|nr:dolichyl-phosphate beta-glucosyltransferase [Candidatus Polarisedimenticolia bacterium]
MSGSLPAGGRPAAPPARPDLSIVIPAYDEAQRIIPTLHAIHRFLKHRGVPAEILVVNDGSRDETFRIVESLRGEIPNLRVLQNQVNRGKGFSIRRGFLESAGRRVLLTDADLSTPIEEIDKLDAAMNRGGLAGAIGSRAVDPSTVELPQGWLRQTMGRTFNRVMRGLTGLPFRDTQCGFKLFDRAAFDPVFRAARVDRFSYDVEVLILARRRGLAVEEIPVLWRNSPQSRVRIVKDSARMLWDILCVSARDRLGMNRGAL